MYPHRTPLTPSLVVALCAALLIGILPSRSAAAYPASGPDPATLYVAYPLAPVTLDPAIMYDFAGPAIVRNLYSTLLRLDGPNATRIVGDLATSWTSNAAKTVWTFTLRHGAYFHDGTPVDAAAVKASMVRVLTINQAPAFIMGQFLTPDRIKVLSPDTLQFNLIPTSPYYAFLTALTSQWSNEIVSPTAVKAHASHGDQAQAWLTTHEAGSGPYMITQYTLNQSVTMSAFPRYYDGWSGHHVKRVVLSIVTEDATRRELIERGGADVSLYFTPQDLDAMRKEAGLTVLNQYGTNSYFITMTEYGPLASAKARQAMAYAFDYHAYVYDLLHGYGKPASGPMAASLNGHDNALKPHATDLAQARSLLKEAGVNPGTTLTLWYIPSDEREKQMAQVLQGQLAQLGLVLQLQPRDSNTVNNLMFSDSPGAAQRPNFFANQWSPDYNDPLDYMTPLYHSRGNSVLGGGSNAGYYHNSTVDALLRQAAHTPDSGKRQAMLDRIQQTLAYDDPAAIYAADVSENPVVRTTVHGFFINPNYEESFQFYPIWKA